MGPVAGALVAGLVGQAASGVAGYLGAKTKHRWDRQEAEKTRAFNERMRNTAWQAGVADMEAAGLNPALAYGRGPAASPSGAMTAPAENPVSSAFSVMQARKGLELLDAQVGKTKAEAGAAEALKDREKARNFAYGLTKGPDGMLRVEMDPGKWPLMRREIAAGVSSAESLARRNRLTGDVMVPMADLAERFGEFLPLLGLIPGLAGPASNMLRRSRRPKAGGPSLQSLFPKRFPKGRKR